MLPTTPHRTTHDTLFKGPRNRQLTERTTTDLLPDPVLAANSEIDGHLCLSDLCAVVLLVDGCIWLVDTPFDAS
jgi:hypothetical protein